VGDDDQNIYEFRGSDSKYLKQLIEKEGAVMYELVENYRSKSNLVDFSNQFLESIPQRLKRTPILAVDRDNGSIKLVRYRGSNLVTPLVNDVLAAELMGSTCILTKTNEEALQITGLLLKEGVQAKLIQSSEGFNLYNLLEIRFFLNRLTLVEGSYTIYAEVWNQAKRELKERFRGSSNYELTTNLIKDFEALNPKSKYKSDLEILIRESKMEDFTGDSMETIYVSTMHKAKGREFDNVYLMLDQFSLSSDEAKRLLYVAMTRAKANLTIHYNGNYLRNISTRGLQSVTDAANYLPPSQLAMQLSHKDVWLDYFDSRQHMVSQLNCGDVLTFDGETCFNAKGVAVLKVSKLFKEKIQYQGSAAYQNGQIPNH
jgi:ATP-dependent DNA helicase RecQ